MTVIQPLAVDESMLETRRGDAAASGLQDQRAAPAAGFGVGEVRSTAQRIERGRPLRPSHGLTTATAERPLPASCSRTIGQQSMPPITAALRQILTVTQGAKIDGAIAPDVLRVAEEMPRRVSFDGDHLVAGCRAERPRPVARSEVHRRTDADICTLQRRSDSRWPKNGPMYDSATPSSPPERQNARWMKAATVRRVTFVSVPARNRDARAARTSVRARQRIRRSRASHSPSATPPSGSAPTPSRRASRVSHDHRAARDLEPRRLLLREKRARRCDRAVDVDESALLVEVNLSEPPQGISTYREPLPKAPSLDLRVTQVLDPRMRVAVCGLFVSGIGYASSATVRWLVVVMLTVPAIMRRRPECAGGTQRLRQGLRWASWSSTAAAAS